MENKAYALFIKALAIIFMVFINFVVYSILTFAICWGLGVVFTFKLCIGVTATAILIKTLMPGGE